MKRRTTVIIGFVLFTCLASPFLLVLFWNCFWSAFCFGTKTRTLYYSGEDIAIYGRMRDGTMQYTSIDVGPPGIVASGGHVEPLRLSAKLSVRLGNQPAIPLDRITPEHVDKYFDEYKTDRKSAPDGRHELNSSEITFCRGAVAAAHFGANSSSWPPVTLFLDGVEIRLPASEEEILDLFGKPSRVKEGTWSL